MINKIDLYKYYRPSVNTRGIDLSGLTQEQFEAFSKSQEKAYIQDKINYLQLQYNSIKSLNTLNPLYRECKAQNKQIETLSRISSEINKLQNQLKDNTNEGKWKNDKFRKIYS